jgi:hypothetical protein
MPVELDINRKKRSISRIAKIIIILVFILCSIGSCYPIIGVTQMDRGNVPVGTPSHSGSTNINNYNQFVQQNEQVFFYAYPLIKDEFFINEPIILQFTIINALDHNIKFSKIECFTPNNINLYNKSLPNGEFWIPNSTVKYFNYTICVNDNPTNYHLGPAILHYIDNGKAKNLSAGLIELNIIDRCPDITNIKIAHKGSYYEFNANLSDPDGRDDIKQWDVWSSLDGDLKSCNNSCQDFLEFHYPISKLRSGWHEITFRVLDKHEKIVEKQLNLNVSDPIEKFLPPIAFLSLFLAVCSFINLLNQYRPTNIRQNVQIVSILFILCIVIYLIFNFFIFRIF